MHGDEAARFERAPEDGNLPQPGLVEDVQPAMETLEEHRWIDVALVIGTEDHGPPCRDLLTSDHAVPDAGRPECERHARVAELEEQPLPAKRNGDQQADRPDD